MDLEDYEEMYEDDSYTSTIKKGGAKFKPTGSMSANKKRAEINKNYSGVPKVLKERAIDKIEMKESN